MTNMKKQMICIAVVGLLSGCSAEPEMKTSEGTYTNDKGDVTSAKIEVKGDKISSVQIDEKEPGVETSKKEQKDSYGMKAASKINKEWYEQVAFFEEYVAKNGINGISMDSDGKAENNDIRTGCTISIKGFIKAIEEAEDDAEENAD